MTFRLWRCFDLESYKRAPLDPVIHFKVQRYVDWSPDLLLTSYEISWLPCWENRIIQAIVLVTIRTITILRQINIPWKYAQCTYIYLGQILQDRNFGRFRAIFFNWSWLNTFTKVPKQCREAPGIFLIPCHDHFSTIIADFWGQNKALVWLYLHSETSFDLLIILAI